MRDLYGGRWTLGFHWTQGCAGHGKRTTASNVTRYHQRDFKVEGISRWRPSIWIITSGKRRSAVRVLQWNSLQHNDEAGQWPWASQSYVTRSTITLSLSPTALDNYMRYPHRVKHCASRSTCDFKFTFRSPEVISLSLFSPLKLRLCNMNEQRRGIHSKPTFSQIC